MTNIAFDFAKAADLWNGWIQSLRVGPRYNVPFLGPTHEGVVHLIVQNAVIVLFLFASAATLWAIRRRHFGQ